MRYSGILSLALAGLLWSTAAQAGAPLKGVGVSLGKTPGGGCATRVTDASGQADFGAWPALAKGVTYTITISALPQDVTVTINGAKGGAIVQDIAAPTAATARASAAQPISFASDGKTPIVVVVDAARVKSHSNITNN